MPGRRVMVNDSVGSEVVSSMAVTVRSTVLWPELMASEPLRAA
jgi:hypothetical protein